MARIAGSTKNGNGIQKLRQKQCQVLFSKIATFLPDNFAGHFPKFSEVPPISVFVVQRA